MHILIFVFHFAGRLGETIDSWAAENRRSARRGVTLAERIWKESGDGSQTTWP